MTEWTRFHLLGSFSRTHKNLVKVKFGKAGLQVRRISCSEPIFSVSCLHCFSVRTSHQMSAGRTMPSDSSSITAPCICPENPTQEMSMPPKPPLAKAFRTATPQARHQSSGFCSAQPIWGEAKGSCSSVADATMRPLLLTMRARVPPVPTSIPNTSMSEFLNSIWQI